MKAIITVLSVAVLALLGTTTQAEARSHRKAPASHTYVSGYRSCGTPIYTQKYFVGYDQCGHAIWRYRILPAPHVHRAPSYGNQGYRPSYPVRSGHSGGYSGGYSNGYSGGHSSHR